MADIHSKDLRKINFADIGIKESPRDFKDLTNLT